MKLVLLLLVAVYLLGTHCLNVENVDALVVGSGYGGSVAAFHLANAGVKTVVLEKGRWWNVTDPTSAATFSSIVSPDSRSTWLRNISNAPGPFPFSGSPVPIFTGIMESYGNEVNENDPGVKIRTNGPIGVNAGVGVGGGSLVTNGVIMKPSKHNFQESFGFDTFETLWRELNNNWYPRVERMFGAKQIPRAIDKHPKYIYGRAFRSQGVNAGFPIYEDDDSHEVFKVDVAIDWFRVQDELDGTRVGSVINGEAWAGVNSDSITKLTSPNNFLGKAIASGNVDIRTLHQVFKLEKSEVNNYEWKVTAHVLDDNGRVKEQAEFHARYLFLAAGSMQTTSLLVQARESDLPQLNRRIGEKWGGNGAVWAERSIRNEETNPGSGGPASYALSDWRDERSPITITLESAAWGPSQGKNNILWHQVMGIPLEEGRFLYDQRDEAVVLNWGVTENPNRVVWSATERLFNELDAANPRSKSSLPDVDEAASRTYSPLGGVVFEHATDEACRIPEYRNLYVVDSSLIPGSTGAVQPALTVAAMAERCMDKIIRRDGIKGQFRTFSSASSTDASLLLIVVFVVLSLAL